MQKTKKLISAFLAVVMVISVLAVGATAGSSAITGSYKVVTTFEVADAEGNPLTEVTPGETVKVMVYGNSSKANDAMTTFAHSIYYNANVYEYVADSVEWLGIASWVDADLSALTPCTEGSTVAAYTKQAALWTAEEKAAHPDWVSLVYVSGIQLAGTTYYVQENKDNAMYSFELKVKDDAPIGADASVGCPASCHFASRASYNYIRTAGTGTIGAGEVQPTTEFTATVAAAAPELAVAEKGPQIRFMKNDDGSFKEINVRTRASVSVSALQELVGATANDDVEKKIVAAGFVYGANLDYAKAVAVAEGKSSEYTKTTVSYIQNTGSEYVFTYLVTGMTADKIAGSDFEALGYITLDIGGTNYTFCYEAETAVSPKAMYNRNVDKANSTYGWTLTAIA